MHISFLLSQLFINKTVKRDIPKSNNMQNRINIPENNNIVKNTAVHTVKHTVADKNFTSKTDNKINSEFPMICDSVEISKDTAVFESIAATGYADSSGAGYASGGESASDEYENSKTSQSDVLPAVTALTGVILVILSLLFLPKSLPITVIGILLGMCGFFKSLK